MDKTTTNLESKVTLGEAAIRYSETVHKALNMRYGISGWYKAYIASEDFQNESSDFKKASFETYQSLSAMLDFMETESDEVDMTLENL
jgi:hypothetical protein